VDENGRVNVGRLVAKGVVDILDELESEVVVRTCSETSKLSV